MAGTLYIVGTPIGNLEDMSYRAIETLRQVDFIAAEDTRVTLKLLNHFEIKKPMVSYHDHNIREKGEQIIAKLSVPPFLLGLSWSTTERMSSQQADILTSELEHYRELLNPVIIKIVKMFLNLRGIDEKITVRWNNINLQDELEMSNARLNRANALRTEMEVKRDFGVVEGENGEITEVKH